ncbi:MAG: hypothetical protein AAB677_01205 [Patescibacteria group bacterium]
MRNFLYVIIAVIVAVSANSISAVWAKPENKFSIWLLAVILISPLVFITYGFVTSRIGVALASSVIDSLMIIGSIIVGLFFFNEWNKILGLQYLGMGLAVLGVLLIIFSPYLTFTK